ncbi:hypothetical protein CRG98_023129 [Punica granatum]|uniref:Uncharacterized protein n=1 Tax=Punica granatum TaxID=22663 RepID=A0A2I0JJP2_PUNGR|nr:hypothetical protein CRG98_023129 [Punica granatum]
MAETIRSLDRVTRIADRRLRGSPILLQIWLQSHTSPFGLVRPVLFFNRSESIILRLLPFVRVEERKASELIKFFREVSHKGFKWRAAWMPPGPMALRCHDFNRIQLLSHAGSTTYFPARVMRQFSSLQTVPDNTAWTKFEHTWRDDQMSVDCQSDIQQWNSSAHEDFTGFPQPESSTPYGAPSTSRRPSKQNSLALGPRGTAFVGRSPRKMSNSSISASFKGSSPKHTPSYKDAVRSWHVRTLLWRATTHFCTTGESCQPSRVDHPWSSPLHGETCCDQKMFIPVTHPARQASRANLRGQVTCGLYPSSMARRAVDRGPTLSKARLTNTNFFLTESVTA